LERLLLATGILLTFCPPVGRAEPPPEDSGNPSEFNGMTKQDAASSGNDVTRPVNSVDIRFQYRPSSAPGSKTEREYAIFRAITRITLDKGWKADLYAQTGVENKHTSNDSGSTSDAGLSNSVVQAALTREFNERWAATVGARVVAPTASDEIGSGKWLMMPVFGVRYTFLELGSDNFFAPQMRYAVSVAGVHSTRDISNLQLAPLLNLDLPGPWFLTLYPSYDVRINFGPPVSGQTGPLFLPADAEIGYKFNDHTVIGIEGSVPIIKDYPVYDFRTRLRVIFKY
jgi:hypothetical protein